MQMSTAPGSRSSPVDPWGVGGGPGRAAGTLARAHGSDSPQSVAERRASPACVSRSPTVSRRAPRAPPPQVVPQVVASSRGTKASRLSPSRRKCCPDCNMALATRQARGLQAQKQLVAASSRAFTVRPVRIPSAAAATVQRCSLVCRAQAGEWRAAQRAAPNPSGTAIHPGSRAAGPWCPLPPRGRFLTRLPPRSSGHGGSACEGAPLAALPGSPIDLCYCRGRWPPDVR